MEYRTLGGSGVQVSTLCLGAMMYGPAGNNAAASASNPFVKRRLALPGGPSFSINDMDTS